MAKATDYVKALSPEQLKELEERIASGGYNALEGVERNIFEMGAFGEVSKAKGNFLRTIKRGLKRNKEASNPDATTGPQRGENPQAGLLQDLFNKSGDELKRIEDGEGAPKSPAEQGEAPLLEESEEDKKIRERIRMFQEGKDPDAEPAQMAGILDSSISAGNEMADDPSVRILQGEDAATPEEEKQLADVVYGSSQIIYGDKMSAFIDQLKKGGEDNLYTPVSFAVYQVLQQQKQELEKGGTKAEPAVFFAETGAVPLVTDMVWDLARQLELPGSDDQNQYAASIINVMKMAGEHVLEAKDQGAIDEAAGVANNMVMASMGGEQTPVAPVKNQLAQGIDTALLGGAV